MPPGGVTLSMTTRPPSRISSTLSSFCTGMRHRAARRWTFGIGGGGGGSGSGSSWAVASGRRPRATSTSTMPEDHRSSAALRRILLEVQAAPRAPRAKARSRASRRTRRSRRPRPAARRTPAAGRVVRVDHAFADEALAHPVEQPAPERLVHQDDRHLPRLAGLHQRQRLEQLVERAEAAGQHDVGGRELARTSPCARRSAGSAG